MNLRNKFDQWNESFLIKLKITNSKERVLRSVRFFFLTLLKKLQIREDIQFKIKMSTGVSILVLLFFLTVYFDSKSLLAMNQIQLSQCNSNYLNHLNKNYNKANFCVIPMKKSTLHN